MAACERGCGIKARIEAELAYEARVVSDFSRKVGAWEEDFTEVGEAVTIRIQKLDFGEDVFDGWEWGRVEPGANVQAVAVAFVGVGRWVVAHIAGTAHGGGRLLGQCGGWVLLPERVEVSREGRREVGRDDDGGAGGADHSERAKFAGVAHGGLLDVVMMAWAGDGGVSLLKFYRKIAGLRSLILSDYFGFRRDFQGFSRGLGLVVCGRCASADIKVRFATKRHILEESVRVMRVGVR